MPYIFRFMLLNCKGKLDTLIDVEFWRVHVGFCTVASVEQLYVG